MAAEKETEAGPYHHWAQARLVLLRLALLHFADTEFWLFCGGALFFYKLKVGGNFELSKSASTFFPTAFAHFMSVSHFGNSHYILKFAIIFLFVMVICDQWPLMLLLEKDYNSLKAQKMVTHVLAIKY